MLKNLLFNSTGIVLSPWEFKILAISISPIRFSRSLSITSFSLKRLIKGVLYQSIFAFSSVTTRGKGMSKIACLVRESNLLFKFSRFFKFSSFLLFILL